MANEKLDTGKLHVVFRKAPYHRYFPATGMWGGLSPNGEVVVHFMVEQQVVPEKMVLEVKNGKKVGEERTGGEEFVRELQCGVVLRPDIAHSIGTFLREKAEQAGYKPSTEEK